MTKTAVSVFRSETLETSGRRICKRTSFEFEANLAKWNPIPPVIRIHACVCVFSVVVYSGKQSAGIGSREIGTKILFHEVTFRLCRECVTLLSSLYTHVHVRERSCRSAVSLENRKSSWNEFRKILSGEWTTRAASPSPEQFLRTLWHRDTLKTCEEYLKHATLAVTTCLGGWKENIFALFPIETELPLVQDHPFFFPALIRVSRAYLSFHQFYVNDFKCSVASIFNRLAKISFGSRNLFKFVRNYIVQFFCFALTFELECVCTYIYSREKYKKPVVTFEFHGKLGRTLPTRCEYFTRAKRMERRDLFGYVASSVDKGWIRRLDDKRLSITIDHDCPRVRRISGASPHPRVDGALCH